MATPKLCRAHDRSLETMCPESLPPRSIVDDVTGYAMTVSAALPRPRHSRNTRERLATVIAIRDAVNIGIYEDCEPRLSGLLPLCLDVIGWSSYGVAPCSPAASVLRMWPSNTMTPASDGSTQVFNQFMNDFPIISERCRLGPEPSQRSARRRQPRQPLASAECQ